MTRGKPELTVRWAPKRGAQRERIIIYSVSSGINYVGIMRAGRPTNVYINTCNTNSLQSILSGMDIGLSMQISLKRFIEQDTHQIKKRPQPLTAHQRRALRGQVRDKRFLSSYLVEEVI